MLDRTDPVSTTVAPVRDVSVEDGRQLGRPVPGGTRAVAEDEEADVHGVAGGVLHREIQRSSGEGDGGTERREEHDEPATG